MQKKLSQLLFISGGTITITGAVLQLFKISYAPYIFSVGAAILIFLQATIAFDNSIVDLRSKRLSRSGLFASLLLIMAAYLMFTNSNSWVVAVLIYSLSSLFLSFRGN
jgi:UDP-N-acetylglucosamine enolpyruvyl transferase